MPALNFKLRFAARIARGSKAHTIRAWRKRPFKAGDNLAFFSGMRTKQCRRLRVNTRCIAARPIKIDSVRRVVVLDGSRLTSREVDALAKKDGFASTAEFLEFFNQTHGRFLRGQLVEWKAENIDAGGFFVPGFTEHSRLPVRPKLKHADDSPSFVWQTLPVCAGFRTMQTSSPSPILRASLAVLFAAAALHAQTPLPVTVPFPVSIQIDAAQPIGEMKPIWRFFGADEPNYATMKDGRKLLAELGELRPEEIYFRAHNLLCTGDGVPALKWGSTNVYTEDAQGRPVYDWTMVDRIFDTYRARGVRPYAQIGFMPQALSVKPEPYQHEWRPGQRYEAIGTGWAYPPKDYAKWGELVYQWVSHCVGRYGRAEVEKWYWEVWNEPNGAAYWHAAPEDFYKLHDYAIDAVRRALPTARVGGPDVAGSGGKFMQDFLTHVVSGTNYATGQKGTPTDFLAFHAKGQPRFVDGHVRLGISAQLGGIDRGFAMIAAVPELKSKPIVIGESDPDGCAACQGPQLGYRTGTMYSSYTAAAFARKYALADKHGVNLEGALTWAFEFEDQPFFAGQRVLATNGLDLPVLNVFRMLSKMGGQRVGTKSSAEVSLDSMIKEGVRGAPDVAALTSLDGKKLSVLVWHYHDDDIAGPAAQVEIALAHLPFSAGTARLTHYRIDETHSNSYAVWKQLGAPTAPSEAQYAQIQQAGQLATMADAPATVMIADGSAALKLTLPRQAVALLVLDWSAPAN